MQPALDEKDDVGATPIKALPAQRKPVRLRADHQQRLRDAKLDLGARFRVETDENVLLGQFFEEAFEAWFRSKLEAAPKRSGRKGEKA